MNQVDPRIIFGVWLVAAVVVISALCYFTMSGSTAHTKRHIFRWYMFAGGLIILTWFTLLGGLFGFLMAILLYPVSAY